MGGLETALSALVAVHAAQTVCIAFVDLGSGAIVEIHAGERMHAASTMKLPVLIAAHRLVHEGKLRLDAPVLVANHFRSLADGSDFSTDPKNDHDDWMYAQIGKLVPLSRLLERMIVRSSNLATNLVMEQVPATFVTATCRKLGTRDLEVLRGVEDGRAHDKGLDNTTTAHDLAVLLRAVASSAAAPAPSSTAAAAPFPTAAPAPSKPQVAGAEAILALLQLQELNEGIPAGLPPGTPVAHKTGSISAHYHDAAIVSPPGRAPYVLVVMTRGFAEEKDAVALVRDVSRTVFAQP